MSFGRLLRQRSFWLLAFGSFCSMGAIGSVTQHLKLMFLDKGISEATVADTTFLLLIFSNLGRIGMGWLADRFPKKFVMVAAYLFVGLPLPMLFFADHTGIPWIFAMIYGFGLGADFMMIPLMAAELFGANSLARVMGIILPVYSIGLTLFPFVLGVMHDQLGNYNAALLMISALALIWRSGRFVAAEKATGSGGGSLRIHRVGLSLACLSHPPDGRSTREKAVLRVSCLVIRENHWRGLVRSRRNV